MKTNYRQEWMNFKTKNGIQRKLIVIAPRPGENAGQERKRLIEKAERKAREMNWKLL